MRLYPLDYILLIIPPLLLVCAIVIGYLQHRFIRIITANPSKDYSTQIESMLGMDRSLEIYLCKIMIPYAIVLCFILYFVGEPIHLPVLLAGILLLVVDAWLMLQAVKQLKQFCGSTESE